MVSPEIEIEEGEVMEAMGFGTTTEKMVFIMKLYCTVKDNMKNCMLKKSFARFQVVLGQHGAFTFGRQVATLTSRRRQPTPE